MQEPWRAKAEKRIAELCTASYRQANTLKDGRRAARHRPYSVPALAEELVECLKNDDEARAKLLFINWDVLPPEAKH